MLEFEFTLVVQQHRGKMVSGKFFRRESTDVFLPYTVQKPRLHVRDRVLLRLRRAGEELELSVTVSGYLRPRVRFVAAPDVTPAQRARRLAWLAGE